MAASRPVHKQLARLARKHAKKFFSLESACLQGNDVEAVHDMRVASRRLHEALRLGTQMAGVKLPKALVKPIRDARNALSGVRDLDVMIERLRAETPRASGAKAVARQEVLQLLGDQRAKQLRKMRRRLAKLKLGLFLTEFEPRLKDKLWQPWNKRIGAAQGQTDPEADACFLRALAEREAQWEQEAHAAATSQQDVDLHRARIAAKKVRYLLELGGACGLGQFRSRIRRLRSVQDALGRWHDFMVIEHRLLGLVADPEVLERRLAMCQYVLDVVALLRKKRSRLVRRFVRLAERVPTAEAATSPGPAAPAPGEPGRDALPGTSPAPEHDSATPAEPAQPPPGPAHDPPPA